MTGKTHIAVGALASMVIMIPRTIDELVVSVCLGAIGGMLPDIDIEGSEGKKLIKKLLCAAGILFFCLVGRELFYNENLRSIIKELATVKVIALQSLIILLIIGFKQPHRGLTHSIEYVVLVGMLIYMIFGVITASGIMVGMLSHNLLDLLNYKTVLISALFKIKICMKFAPADGKLSKAVQILSISLIPIVYIFR